MAPNVKCIVLRCTCVSPAVYLTLSVVGYTATNNNEWGEKTIGVRVTQAAAFSLKSEGAVAYSFNSLGLQPTGKKWATDWGITRVT